MNIPGLADLDRALGELPKNIGKNVLRRVARKALAPFLERVKSMAPVDDPSGTPERAAGSYRDSWRIGTQLNRSQRKTAKREGKSSVEVYAGSTQSPLGTRLEWGTTARVQGSTGRDVGQVTAQPHAVPAWDSEGPRALQIIKDDLGSEIEKAATRLANRRARG